MRPLLTSVLLGLALPLAAQIPATVTPSKAVRDLKEAMVVELNDPATQVAIGITSTQRSLQEIRLAQDALSTSLDLLHAALQSDAGAGAFAFSATFSSTPARALYPYLAGNQLAKLRRLTLAHQPLTALGTEEVAFALSLSDAQRRAIEMIRAAQATKAADPHRPSIRFLTAAFARLAKESEKVDADGSLTPETVDAMRPILARLFHAMEESSRLAAKEPAIPTPDPLRLLTAAQVRRYRALSSGTLAFAPPHALVARRG